MRHFVSAGWPYLYDIPGLHNCVPMLFADVCARFHRLRGEEVFFLCGADEHGARTEYVADGYNLTPKQLVDSKCNATLPLLSKLELSLDAFERTGDPFHFNFVNDIFQHLMKHGSLTSGKQKVGWCASCQRYLPDRFLEGSCPYCLGLTYGNQCNNKKTCARLVEPEKIKDVHCAVCRGTVMWKEEEHFFFDLGKFHDKILNAVRTSKQDMQEVFARIERAFTENSRVCVTRNTDWGIPVPGSPGKTVYSWVDSLLAKISMLAKRGDKMEKDYWCDPATYRHFFLGMDGVPFYGALFPELILASGRNYSITNWFLRPNEVFIYEGGVCSKSTGTGIWLEEALATLPGDFWRFYIFFVHANVESGAERDVDFRWERFCQTINQWILENLAVVSGSLVSGPDGESEEKEIIKLMEDGQIGNAFQFILNALVNQPSRFKTKRLASLLGCFLPVSGARLLESKRPFEMAPLYHREVQMSYQQLVDNRRGERSLSEEITDARADALCVCPINLREQ